MTSGQKEDTQIQYGEDFAFLDHRWACPSGIMTDS
jgi:rubredoxin